MKLIVQIAIGSFFGYIAADWVGYFILRELINSI